MILPTYNQQTFKPYSGASTTTIGAKREFFYGQDWVASAEVFLTPAGGSTSFGNQGVGGMINGMFSYHVRSDLLLTFMAGESTSTESRFWGGERFNSFNPSTALLYLPTEHMSVFIEAFAQTKTGPGLGGNYNADVGILYSLTPNIVLDLEVGQQLTHQVDSFKQFIGGGISMKL